MSLKKVSKKSISGKKEKTTGKEVGSVKVVKACRTKMTLQEVSECYLGTDKKTIDDSKAGLKRVRKVGTSSTGPRKTDT